MFCNGSRSCHFLPGIRGTAFFGSLCFSFSPGARFYRMFVCRLDTVAMNPVETSGTSKSVLPAFSDGGHRDTACSARGCGFADRGI